MLMYASVHNHVRSKPYVQCWCVPVHIKAHQYNFGMHAVVRSCKAVTLLPMSGSVSQGKYNGSYTTGNVHLPFINSQECQPRASMAEAGQKIAM